MFGGKVSAQELLAALDADFDVKSVKITGLKKGRKGDYMSEDYWVVKLKSGHFVQEWYEATEKLLLCADVEGAERFVRGDAVVCARSVCGNVYKVSPRVTKVKS